MGTVRGLHLSSSSAGVLGLSVWSDRWILYFNPQEGARRFKLQVEMQCRCIGCVKKVEKAMASIGSLRGTAWLTVLRSLFLSEDSGNHS